ncbi:unnamed protein product [Caenorhabditis auriculariae]|uniref:TAFH domain-containing protein n=1 Tax=Caenorhabditis auriculariae TaxID=2777116 RepID=A0A8S1GPB4_9PELO|nr:unnamed protein product [Caenorhabditis auriculariae]
MSGPTPSVPRFRLVQGRAIGERSSTPTASSNSNSSLQNDNSTRLQGAPLQPQPLAQVQSNLQHSQTTPNLNTHTRITSSSPPTPRSVLQHQTAPTPDQRQQQQMTPQPQPPPPPTPQTTSADDKGAVHKCIRFLRTLILLSNQASTDPNYSGQNPEEKNRLVCELIGKVLYGDMTPEEFTQRLQEALSSQAQPHLLPFLQNTLPALRTALKNREVEMEGISPPEGFVFNSPPQPQPTPSPVSQAQSNVAGQSLQAPPQQHASLVARLNAPPTQFPNAQPPPIRQVHQPSPQMAPTSVPKTSTAVHSGYPANASTPQPPAPQNLHQGQSQPPPQAIPDETVQPGKEEEQSLSSRPFTESSLKSLLLRPEEIMNKIMRRMNSCFIEEEVITLISDAAEYRLREVITEIAFIADHRMEAVRSNENYILIDDARRQLRFLEDFDRQEEELRDNREKETLIRMSKSKGIGKETIERAKELQRVDAEAKRNREANAAAIAALSGTRQVRNKWEGGAASSAVHRPRTVRVHTRDLHVLVNNDLRFSHSFLRQKLCYSGPVAENI